MMKSPGIGPSATTATAPQVLVPSVSGPTSHTPPGLLPIQAPTNDAQMPTNLAPIMLGEKRPASGHPGPSPSPVKTAKLDPEIYKNGIIGIAKSSSGTPPVVRTPLSHESIKPHTTSAESSHPSDPGHRIASARATPLSSLPPSAASLFINTNAPGSQPQPTAELLQQLAAAAAGQGPHATGSIDTLRLLNGHPALAQFTAGSLTAGTNPFLAAAAASTTGGLPLFNPQMFLQSQAQQLQQVQQASQNSQQASAMIQQAALNAAVAQHLPAGLQFPPNAALGSQLAGAALLGSQNAANAAASSMVNKKPGRWCGMHVKIAMQIDEHKKQLAKQAQLAQHPGPSSAHPSTSGPIGGLHHSVSTAPTTSTQPIMSAGSAHSTASGASSVATDPALNRLPPPADMAQLLQAAQQQHHAQQQLLAAVAVSRSALISGQPSAGPGQSASSLTPQQNAQPHCLPSTSTAQQAGLPLSFPHGLLASLPPFAQPNPHLMSAALQEATRRVAATPKPAPTSLLQPLQQSMSQGGRTSSVMSRGPTNQPTNPGQSTNFPAGLPSGLPGLPPGFHLGANGPGLSLPPPAAGASLTNGTSDAAAQQQALLHAVMMQHQHQQQQNQQAEQQRREQAQREQHQFHAQQQQQQAAQLQAHQQLLASAAAQQHLLGIQTSSANANPAAQLAARNAAADQANVMALMQQIQMMQQLGNPGQALQLLAQLQAHQSGGLAAAAPTPSAVPHTQAPPTSALNQPNQMDLLRAQLEQAQTSRANPLDSDAFMRMYSSQQQLSAANNSTNSNPSGRPAVFEALLALQASQGNHQGSQQPGNRLGLPPAGLPGLGLPQQQGIPGPNPSNLSSAGSLAPSSVVSTATSQNGPSIGTQNPNAALFAPLLGLPNLSAPQNFLGQKLPFPAGGLQQLVQVVFLF
ncbi:hypothetical protein WR25_07506 isoform C [Diploscapter pachys]|uniref:Uncharacterized protein n=1 Tax=Diploscapter pachys TaxID=2018661 RepID=A0A2A2JK81_9BILA|nr:hypothetical protein WR25_07506 isoform C [Diploscapter pachys]